MTTPAACRNIGLNIIILGEEQVGKTALMRMFLDSDNTKPATADNGFIANNVTIGDRVVNVKIWDTANQEKFQNAQSDFCRSVHCCVLVFDITSAASMYNLEKWRKYFVEKKSLKEPNSFPFICIGNKNDLSRDREISLAQAKQWSLKLNMPYFETSTTEAANLQAAMAFRTIVETALEQELDINPLLFEMPSQQVWADLKTTLDQGGDALGPSAMLNFDTEQPTLYDRLLALAEHIKPKPAKQIDAQELAQEGRQILTTMRRLVQPDIYVPHMRTYEEYKFDRDAVRRLSEKNERDEVHRFFDNNPVPPIRVADLAADLSSEADAYATYERESSEIVLSTHLHWALNNMINGDERKFALSIVALRKQGHEVYRFGRLADFIKRNNRGKSPTRNQLNDWTAPPGFRAAGAAKEESDRGQVGRVVEDMLLNGSVEVSMVVSMASNVPAEIRVVFYPSKGRLRRLPCQLSIAFLRDFAAKPRAPHENELKPFRADICMIDLHHACGASIKVLKSQLAAENAKHMTNSIPGFRQMQESRSQTKRAGHVKNPVRFIKS